MTTRLLVATTNPGKIAEIKRLLADCPIEVLGLDAYPNAPELPEPFETFAANAESKARAAAEFADCLALADDSGLEVAALGGRPGVYSSRYAPTDPERIAKLLGEMKDFTGEQRRARFVCAIALATPEKTLGLWQETCEGLIAEAPRGDNGFGFDPVFLYGDRTFAELSAAEKNAVSHRGQAMRAFAADFAKILK
jgi:XTP/dITP diphosphohydrolase